MRLYPKQFDRIGYFPGTVKLSVNPEVTPRIDAPRKTPIFLKDEIKSELEDMKSNGVIRRVTEPSDWVSSLAYSRKQDGKIRIAEENGLVFNSKKCLIKKKQIKFFGTIYADNGIHPDPKKIEDLKNMPTPQNKKELQEFLGFITYMAPFIPNLSSQSACLRDLLKNDVSFIWEPHHKLCFETLKNCITTDSTLQYYDTSVTPVLQVDASLRGLGASLLQNGRPVAFASKSLSDIETRYACIERELLAIVFGVQRFHTYLYGRSFKVITDHKPLVMIL